MKFGYFDDQNKEYVITTPQTPLPWINYLGSEDFFSLVSNTAGGYSFYRDARMRRLTRYRYNNSPLDMDGHRIYIKDGVPLNASDKAALESVGHKETDLKVLKKSDPDIDKKLMQYMCGHYFDIRTFGAVMTTFVKASLNCGQVRGPVQLGFARSVDPIMPQEVTITRVAITTEEDAAKKGTEMGRKFIVPYGLYRAEGFVSANLARKTTGFDEDDLALLWKAILNMFENDRSAARGMMAVRKLVIFKHDSELGNAPAWKLFKLVDVQRKPEIAAPRSFEDYQFSVDTEHLPQGVTCQIME